MLVPGLLALLLFIVVAYIVLKFLLRMYQGFTANIETSESIKRVEKKLDELAKQSTN